MAEGRFGALRNINREPVRGAVGNAAKLQSNEKSPTAESATAPLRVAGKSSHEDFERLTVYVRKDTKKEAARKWEDATDRDVSDLVQHLLSEYLNT